MTLYRKTGKYKKISRVFRRFGHNCNILKIKFIRNLISISIIISFFFKNRIILKLNFEELFDKFFRWFFWLTHSYELIFRELFMYNRLTSQ